MVLVFTSFGYGYSWREDQLFITFLLENSPAEQANIPLGSQILAINDNNYEKVNEDGYCQIKEVGLPSEEVKEIVLKYKTPDGKIKEVKLEERQLL